jgi:hypothetical protein
MKRLVVSAMPVSISAVLLLGVSAQAAQTPTAPPVVEAEIVNDSFSPIPVTGEVNATISEDVEVTGSVEVETLPQSFDSKMDELIDAVETSDQPAPATFVRDYSRREITALSAWNVEFDAPVTASLLTMSSENDSGRISYCTQPLPTCVPVIQIGVLNELPNVVVLPLTQPVVVYGFRFFCGNTVQDCEIAVSVVGDLAEF